MRIFILSPVLSSLYQPCLQADNPETDPNCALQTKGSLCVILIFVLSVCSTSNFAKAQFSCWRQRAGKQFCCWRETIRSFSTSKEANMQQIKLHARAAEEAFKELWKKFECFICYSWYPLLAMTSSKLQQNCCITRQWPDYSITKAKDKGSFVFLIAK